METNKNPGKTRMKFIDPLMGFEKGKSDMLFDFNFPSLLAKCVIFGKDFNMHVCLILSSGQETLGLCQPRTDSGSGNRNCW